MEVIFCSVVYLKNQLIKNERDTIKQLNIYNELKQNGLREDKNNWITLITRDPMDPILDTGFLNVPHAQGTSRG